MIPSRVEASKTLTLLKKVKELKASGVDIASFTAGEPDFNTPELVMDKAIQAMKGGDTKYVDSQGHLALRQAIAEDYRTRLKAPWVSEKNILVTAGSKQAIALSMIGLLDAGDEVLVPSPYWVSYPDLVAMARGRAVVVPSKKENGFFPTVDELNRFYTPKTKALIFSSPSNPTGTMIERAQLESIVKWCREKKVVLFFDEIYERIVFRGHAHVSTAALVDETSSDVVLSINAFSKTLAMTGWRLGYIVSSEKNIKNLTAIQSQMLTCVPGFIQQAGEHGMRNAQRFWPKIMESFQNRKDLIFSELSRLRFAKPLDPQGAFYVFLDVSAWVQKSKCRDDLELSQLLLEKWKVSVVPGSSFGMNGWVRLSFATSEEEIKTGCARLIEFESSL